MHLRLVQPSDNPFLAHLIRAVFHEYNAPKEGTVYADSTTDHLYELFLTEQSQLCVAEFNDVIVGCCGIYPTPGLPDYCVELVKLYLSQSARGQGIGKALLEKSIEGARKLGYTQVYLESLPIFSTAVHLYKNTGFQTLEQPLGASGHTSCNVWMLKDLTDSSRSYQ